MYNNVHLIRSRDSRTYDVMQQQDGFGARVGSSSPTFSWMLAKRQNESAAVTAVKYCHPVGFDCVIAI